MVHHEVAEQEEIRAQSRCDYGSFIHAHDLGVFNDAAMRVKLHALFQNQGVVTALCIRKLHAVTVLKWTGIRHVCFSS